MIKDELNQKNEKELELSYQIGKKYIDQGEELNYNPQNMLVSLIIEMIGEPDNIS